MSGVAWGRLLRLSLAPSAAADALAGMTLGAWGAFPLDPRAALLPVASLCVFHGGMALNDWADREGDARTRPERPIPSGAVSAASALRVGLALLVIGPLLAALAAPLAGACLAGVALTAALYDLTGRGAWLGPTLLGLCRAGNLASGVYAGVALSRAGVAPAWAWWACGVYGAYVFCASRLARLEDDEDVSALGGRPTRALLGACACLALAPWIAVIFEAPDWPPYQIFGFIPYRIFDEPAPSTVALRSWMLAPAALLAGYSAASLAREALRKEDWTRARVGRTAGMALRRLLVFSAAVAWCAPLAAGIDWDVPFAESKRAWVVAPLLLLGYPIALRLRRVFPPT
ncbi:MAG TPA: UbiA family prenyltransferase [Planctomycetota bacterium]|nr:UbiA family prenyltransferase [Planctomycetota bacterium]